ncbi:AfsR/SARP family transcriptional regulator [Arthrobacter sp. 35W]|uniref:AfsR/SARP family transcriptional regulator n=1 Tax=Arthrobacter sp. 35W TaxID=1132441 RepID=UPI000419EEDD|nr:bacterial transcriptional activator domain-containing protein [Arthrobacter sp. 35W]
MDAQPFPVWDLKLLGCWQLSRDGQTIDIGVRQQRLIVASILLGARPRHVLAGLLWPLSPEAQAAASLRATLFTISHRLPSLLCCTHDSIVVDSEVRVDYHRIAALIEAIDASGGDVPAACAEELLRAELLPGWYDDWIIFEQERLQQRRLQALETLAARLLEHGDAGRALDTACAAASIDPLRESCQMIIIQCHLRLGNRAMALRSYGEYRERLRRELGISPSARLGALVAFGSEPGGANRHLRLGALRPQT